MSESYPNEESLIEISKKGRSKIPYNETITCDRCLKTNLEIFIQHNSLHLCYPCNSDIKKKYNIKENLSQRYDDTRSSNAITLMKTSNLRSNCF